MSSDAIVLLKADHKEIRRLFREFEAAGDKAAKKKGKLVKHIIELLTVHTYVENEVMYPRSALFFQTSTTTCSNPMKSITSPTSCAWSFLGWHPMRNASTPRPPC